MRFNMLVLAAVAALFAPTDASAQGKNAPRERPLEVFCAPDGGVCHFPGAAVVRYGANGRFVTRRAVDGVPCNSKFFGDPRPGAGKSCFFLVLGVAY